MNQHQPVDLNKLLKDLMSDQSQNRYRIDLIKRLEGLPESN